MSKIKFETKLVSNLKEHQLASLKGGAIANDVPRETDSINTKFTKIEKCCKK